MPERRAVFAIPGDLDTPTGGYAYDRRMIHWLANWEYGTLVAIASWIKRAHATGKPAPRTKKKPDATS